MKRLVAWACALFLIPALAWAATPTLVIVATDAGGALTYTTPSATGTCPANAVAVLAASMGGISVQTVKDSTDNNTASWTMAGATDNHASAAVFKRKLTAGAITTSTTFTIGSSSSSDGNIVYVYCFADGTGVPTTGDGASDQSTGGGFGPLSINGPSASTSYQMAAYGVYGTTVNLLPDTGSDGSWNSLAKTSVVGGNTYGLAVAWRQGSGPVNLAGTANSFTFNEVAWGEVAASGGGGSTVTRQPLTLLGVQ